jgi:hypothetical protein
MGGISGIVGAIRGGRVISAVSRLIEGALRDWQLRTALKLMAEQLVAAGHPNARGFCCVAAHSRYRRGGLGICYPRSFTTLRERRARMLINKIYWCAVRRPLFGGGFMEGLDRRIAI